MAKLNRCSAGGFKKGLSLLELIISISLMSVVLMTASSLLITFKKFYFDFVENQSQIGEVSLGALENIASKLKVADYISITTTGSARVTAMIRINKGIPGESPNYSYHTFIWNKPTKAISYTSINPALPLKVIAYHIPNFAMTLTPDNKVYVIIAVESSSGSVETFKTCITSQARSAEKI